jgi:hypothetical protein
VVWGPSLPLTISPSYLGIPPGLSSRLPPRSMTNINPEMFLDPLGALLIYFSQVQSAAVLSDGTPLSEEDLQEDQKHLFLDSIFNGRPLLEELPKGHFHLDREDLDEESAEVSIPEFLQHYHTVVDHLERGLCTWDRLCELGSSDTGPCGCTPPSWKGLVGGCEGNGVSR